MTRQERQFYCDESLKISTGSEDAQTKTEATEAVVEAKAVTRASAKTETRSNSKPALKVEPDEVPSGREEEIVMEVDPVPEVKLLRMSEPLGFTFWADKFFLPTIELEIESPVLTLGSQV